MKQWVIIVIAAIMFCLSSYVAYEIVIHQYGDVVWELQALLTALISAGVFLHTVTSSTRKVLLQAGASMGLMLNLWFVVSVTYTTYHAFSGEGTIRWMVSMWCQDHPVGFLLGAMMLPVSTLICWHLADTED